MSDKAKAKLILERWAVGIKREDRKHERMPSIFDELVGQLFAAGVDFEVAHEAMKTAAKLMYPAEETTKHVYFHMSAKAKKKNTFREFVKNWQNDLDKFALEAFYTYYDIEGIDPTKISPIKKVAVIKTEEPGGMVSEDELNEEDFWKSTKSVTRDRPWLFDEENS